MKSPRFIIKSRLISIIYGPDLLRDYGAKMLVVCLCYRDDLARWGERPPSALRFEFRGWHCIISSQARIILQRNLEVAEGKLNVNL
jgi:hypothetical protein